MYTKFQDYLKQEIAQIKADGLYKEERVIESAQGAEIIVKGKKCLNFYPVFTFDNTLMSTNSIYP